MRFSDPPSGLDQPLGRILLEVGDLPSFDELQALEERDSMLVYAVGASAVGFYADRYGEEGVRRLLARMMDGRQFPEAFRDTTGLSVADFEQDWRRSRTGISGTVRALLIWAFVVVAIVAVGSWRRRRRRARPDSVDTVLQ